MTSHERCLTPLLDETFYAIAEWQHLPRPSLAAYDKYTHGLKLDQNRCFFRSHPCRVAVVLLNVLGCRLTYSGQAETNA